MGCAFCPVGRDEEDAAILDESDETLAFAPLDHLSEGHMLVIPKEHYETLLDVPEPTLCAVMEHAKTISQRLCAGDFEGVNLLHASGGAAQQSVQHFHVHLAPRREGDQLDLWPDSSYDETETDQIYEHVRTALTAITDSRHPLDT